MEVGDFPLASVGTWAWVDNRIKVYSKQSSLGLKARPMDSAPAASVRTP
jgi:hypothetical protein